MPQELLHVPILYSVVGAYRLLHDAHLRDPLWTACRGAASRGAAVAFVWCLFSYPWTSFYTRHIAKRAALFSFSEHSQYLGVNVMTYATFSFLFGQASLIIEFFLSRQLRKARADAYDATVKSRGKDASFWTPYVEEWAVPPIERAKRAAEKASWYARVSNPIVRLLLVKVMLMPLSFVPLLGMIVHAALRSLTMARTLHEPYFKAKQLTVFQKELFVVERLPEYRAFGFTAALLERVPILGLVFSVSNRVGAAMWAHDLEKHQHAVRDGAIPRDRVYTSKTAAIAEEQAKDPLPQHSGPGAFQTSKTPIHQTAANSAAIREAAGGTTTAHLLGVEGQGSGRRNVPPRPSI